MRLSLEAAILPTKPPWLNPTIPMELAFTWCFKVELISSGDAGDATFKWSHDGGATYFGRDDPDQADWLAEKELYDDIDFSSLDQGAAIVEMPNGNLLGVYGDATETDIYGAISTDRGMTWGTPFEIDDSTSGPSDIVILDNGRILIFDMSTNHYYSDDNGHTWKKDNTVILPGSQRKLTLQENGIVELKDSRLWMYMRTTHGFQYGCYSSDNGLNWSQPKPTALASPCSPATIERIPWTGDLLCIWNDHSGLHPFKPKWRTPLCAAVSKDEGLTWTPSKIIENKPDSHYCYTSLTFLKDQVILSYWGENSAKVISLSKDWLYPPEISDLPH